MGPRLKLPRFVHGFVDRHGKPRFYFRRPGFRRMTLRGLPYSPEFMRDYEAAMAEQPLPVGVDRACPGTMQAVALSYFASPEFRTLRQSTQRAYRWTIERLCREHGDKRAALLRREHIVRLMAAHADRPATANALRMALRVMMRHAVELGMRDDDPTRDVRAIRVKSDGHHSWTREAPVALGKSPCSGHSPWPSTSRRTRGASTGRRTRSTSSPRRRSLPTSAGATLRTALRPATFSVTGGPG